MSTGWDGIESNRGALGEAIETVGGYGESLEGDPVIKKSSGQISGGVLTDGVRVLEDPNSGTEFSKGGHVVELKMADRFAETKNRVVELMSRDNGWGSKGVMNLVGKVLGGKFCMDDEVEDEKNSGTGNDINRVDDVVGAPIFENEKAVNESVISRGLNAANFNFPYKESGRNGKQNFFINDQVRYIKEVSEEGLDVKQGSATVPDGKSESEVVPDGKSEDERVPDGKPESEIVLNSKLESQVELNGKQEYEGFLDNKSETEGPDSKSETEVVRVSKSEREDMEDSSSVVPICKSERGRGGMLSSKSKGGEVLDSKLESMLVPDSKLDSEEQPTSKLKSEEVLDSKLESHVVPGSKSRREGLPVCKSMASDLNSINDADVLHLKETGEEFLAEEEIVYNVSDIVWGKVRSHPWWPGQIFEPSAASGKAIKYFKKDNYLIAYFGDETFAWNDTSKIKPFRMHFSEMEKQSDSEGFCRAVDCALDEISRRIEIGLSCRCLPEEVHVKIKSQIVHNAGIQEKSSIRDDGNMVSTAVSFLHGDFLQTLESLAVAPRLGTDKLHLRITKAQLLAFSRWKGYYKLPTFVQHGELLDNDTQIAVDGRTDPHDMMIGTLAGAIDAVMVSSGVRKSTIKHVSSRKRKRLPNGKFPKITENCIYVSIPSASSSIWNDEKSERKSSMKTAFSGKKRGLGVSTQSNSTVKRQKTASTLGTNGHMPSQLMSTLRIGERICQAFESGFKVNNAMHGGDGKMFRSRTGSSILDEMSSTVFHPHEVFSKLNLAATNPMQGHVILSSMIDLLYQFRCSMCLVIPSVENVEICEGKQNFDSVAKDALRFESTEDSYWTDRIIQDCPQEQLSKGSENPTERDAALAKSEGNICMVTSLGNQNGQDAILDFETENLTPLINKGSKEGSPTALILNFTSLESIPSISNLNDIFRRYGPLNESQTKILKRSKRARIIFKMRPDAETAFSSSGKYSIFGPALISYSLQYDFVKTCNGKADSSSNKCDI